MNPARYARVRELFLAADELPSRQQEQFLKAQTGSDTALFDEVWTLLAEHDPESARVEGEQAAPIPIPKASKLTTSGRRTARSESRASDSTRRGDSVLATKQSANAGKAGKAAAKTQHAASRTHAAPRLADSRPNERTPSPMLWADRTRKNRRRTSGWLWLAALLPTALIGWWTYRQVESSLRQSVENELNGVADSVALASERYLKDKAQLVESWSRQPGIQRSIMELVDIARNEDAPQKLRAASQTDQILSQLQQLSGHADVKFVVWNESYKTLASWLPNRVDVGNPVHPSDAAHLARVMQGETVLFGPKRVPQATEGVVPETAGPVMAVIVPIRNERQRVIAALLVRGIGMFDEYNSMFDRVAMAGKLDVYAVDPAGLMVTDSGNALALATQNRLDLSDDEIAGRFRVADPGVELSRENISSVNRSLFPLTKSVASATVGMSDSNLDRYRNYAGHSVVGAWRWDPERQLGIIIEQDAERAFEAVGIVRFGFLLLGSLLTLTAFGAAAKIARTSTREHAAVHPLSRYELLNELGSGGMGVVYRARHRQLGRQTALKVLIGDRPSKEDRLRFDREARLAASLSNPHSVTIYDYGRSEQGEAYCVMEFLVGLNLHEVVTRSGHQPVGRVLFVLSQICDALAEAHGMNLLHRDIKPQNIMLSLDASVGDWAVVFDYGLAKPLEPDTSVYQTSESIWSGTPMYMAPERFRAPSVMDPRSDIYSVGCVAYFLLSGRPPFIESDPESLFALIISQQPIGIAIHRGETLPQNVTDLVSKCMAKHADDRYASIKELSEAIDRLRSEHPWTVEDARDWWKKHDTE